MVNFKKVLGLAAPALVFAGMAFGQTPVACTLVSPAAPYIRAEGTTELLPQIQVLCPTGTVLPSPLNAQVFVTPVVGITSLVLNTTTGATEAAASATTAGPAIAQGAVTGNAVTFSGITPASGTAPFVISNIRINASQIPVATGIPNAVNVSVFITSGNSVVATVAATPIAYVVPGLAASKISGVSGVPVCNGSLANSPGFTVTIADFFPGAFKIMGAPSSAPAMPQESSSLLVGSNAVNSGTRIKLVFSGVPSGATVYVPTSVVASDGSKIALTASETGAFSQVANSTATGAPTSQGAGAVTITGGTGQAVYEVLVANSTTIDTYSVPVFLVAASNSVPPSTTPMSVAVSFAPIGSTNIPNFVVGSSTTSLTGSAFSVCATNLLYPYITNLSGYDTGLAIANTSTDPFGSKLGAVPQAGNCTLNFYGAGAPSGPVTSPSIPSGTVFTQILSNIAPGFQGYMIAQCDFLFAHGYAFITNMVSAGTSGVAEGYLAGIIPDVNLTSGRKASPPTVAGAGESLGN